MHSCMKLLLFIKQYLYMLINTRLNSQQKKIWIKKETFFLEANRELKHMAILPAKFVKVSADPNNSSN